VTGTEENGRKPAVRGPKDANAITTKTTPIAPTPAKEFFLGGKPSSVHPAAVQFSTPSTRTDNLQNVSVRTVHADAGAVVSTVGSNASTAVKSHDIPCDHQLWQRESYLGDDLLPESKQRIENEVSRIEMMLDLPGPAYSASMSPQSKRSSVSPVSQTACQLHFQRPAYFPEAASSIGEAVALPRLSGDGCIQDIYAQYYGCASGFENLEPNQEARQSADEAINVDNSSYDICQNSSFYSTNSTGNNSRTATDWLFDASILSQTDPTKAPYQTPTRAKLFPTTTEEKVYNPSSAVKSSTSNSGLVSTPVHTPKLLMTGTPVIASKTGNHGVLRTPQSNRAIPDMDATVNRQRGTNNNANESRLSGDVSGIGIGIGILDSSHRHVSQDDDDADELPSAMLPSPYLPPRPYANNMQHPVGSTQPAPVTNFVPVRRVYDARNGSF
jgi:hypothetical protein